MANLLKIEVIPVYRDLSKYEAETKSNYKQKILAVLGGLGKSKPKYEHQGKAVADQVVKALSDDKNVFLAPSGVAKRDGLWRPGISHIIDDANQELQEFALSFVYIPESFRDKHSFILFNSWNKLLDEAALSWTNDHHQNAADLQNFYESLRKHT